MAVNLHQLIAAISPETYCVASKRREVRRAIEDGLKKGDPLMVHKALTVAEPLPVNEAVPVEPEHHNAFSLTGLKHPVTRHSLSYDCMEDSVEAFYFNLLDWLEGRGWQITKLVDHLSSAAGSGFAGDMSRRAMTLQQEAAKLLEAAQELVGKMLLRVERIKELERRLNVISGGQSPLNLQAAPASTANDADGLARLPSSPGDLRTRLDIERRQLRGQMDLLRLHARWVQPWLRASEELREHVTHRADIVTAFNTALLDVKLLARRNLPLDEMIRDGELPRIFSKSPHRNYTPGVLIELRFRTAPKRVNTGTHVFRGRVEVVLTSYALHDAEVATLQRELERDEVGHLLGAVGAGSVAATEAMVADIERLLAPDKETVERPEHADSNPFVVLWSLFRDLWRWLFSGMREEQAPDGAASDQTLERVLRSQAVLLSRRDCLELFEAIKRLTRAVSARY